MLQNRFVLGAVSFLLLAACALFVLQPTSIVHAEAKAHVQHADNGIAVFGSVKLTNGDPVPGVKMLVGIFRK